MYFFVHFYYLQTKTYVQLYIYLVVLILISLHPATELLGSQFMNPKSLSLKSLKTYVGCRVASRAVSLTQVHHVFTVEAT